MKRSFESVRVESKGAGNRFFDSLNNKEDDMKTRLTLLMAGLIFLATPMLATADGRCGDERQHHYKGRVKHGRHEHRPDYGRTDYRPHHRYDQRRHYRAKRQLKRELRRTRQQLHRVKRQIRHTHRRLHYARHHVKPVVLPGLPHLVFHFNW